MFDIIAFGSATVDIFVDTFDRKHLSKLQKKMKYEHIIQYPVGDKILIKDLHLSIGGGGTNVAVTFKRFGFQTAYCGCLGNDYYSAIIQEFLEREGITFIGHHFEDRTGTSIILDSIEHDRTILAYKGANDYLSFAKLKGELLHAKLYYFSSLLNASFETQMKLLDFAKKHKIKVAFNPSSYQAEKGCKVLGKALSMTNYLILNKEEAQQLLAHNSVLEKELLLKLYSNLNTEDAIVVITDGANGAYAYNGKKFYRVSVPPVQVVEATGAGDAFASAFVSSIVLGYPIEHSLKLASANSQSVITHVGAKEIILTHAEAEDYIKKNTYDVKEI
jgi:ribokinase